MTELLNKVTQGDCLEVSEHIETGSVDLILTDLPYGNMNTDGGRKLGINGWDFAIDPTRIYEIANRILRKNGKMILFSQEPYTTELITKAIPNIPFTYRAVWEKDNFANALGVNKAMVSFYEDILIFSKKQCYEAKHPLKEIFNEIYKKHNHEDIINAFRTSGRFSSEASIRFHASIKFGYGNGMVFELMVKELFDHVKKTIEIPYDYEFLKHVDDSYKKEYASTFNLWEGNKYKSNILKYKKDYDGFHPTQKPVLLLEDLIKTFSNDEDLVVDLTCGSGSTCIAAINTNRQFIGIERESEYVEIAKRRIKDAISAKGGN